MKLQANKADYDVSDVIGLDRIEHGHLWMDDPRTHPGANSVALVLTGWKTLAHIAEACSKKNNGKPLVGYPIHVGLSDGRQTLRFFPSPSGDYEVEIVYSTLNKL
jgi:hypothetical protein